MAKKISELDQTDFPQLTHEVAASRAGETRRISFSQIRELFAYLASEIEYDPENTVEEIIQYLLQIKADRAYVDAALSAIGDGWQLFPRFLPTPIFSHLDGYPSKSNPLFRYVILTAGLTGPGQYNEGVLINEQVSGSAPTITATAVINLPGSPAHGQTIQLINTSKLFLRPVHANNVIEAGQNLSHTHSASASSDSHSHSGTTSTDTHTHSGSTSVDTHNHKMATGGDSGPYDYGVNLEGFDNDAYTGGLDNEVNTSSDSHSHSLNINSDSHNHSFSTSVDTHSHTITVNANGGNEARPRNLSVPYIMRIL